MNDLQPVRYREVIDAQETAIGASCFLRIPLLGDYLIMPALIKTWRKLDRRLTLRRQASYLPESIRHRTILENLCGKIQSSVGWAHMHVDPNDEVGALLWHPLDLLSGVQVLIEAEAEYGLPAGTLDWELWATRPLAELVDFIVAQEGKCRA
jgi:hypothetical protein